MLNDCDHLNDNAANEWEYNIELCTRKNESSFYAQLFPCHFLSQNHPLQILLQIHL